VPFVWEQMRYDSERRCVRARITQHVDWGVSKDAGRSCRGSCNKTWRRTPKPPRKGARPSRPLVPAEIWTFSKWPDEQAGDPDPLPRKYQRPRSDLGWFFIALPLQITVLVVAARKPLLTSERKKSIQPGKLEAGD